MGSPRLGSTPPGRSCSPIAGNTHRPGQRTTARTVRSAPPQTNGLPHTATLRRRAMLTRPNREVRGPRRIACLVLGVGSRARSSWSSASNSAICCNATSSIIRNLAGSSQPALWSTPPSSCRSPNGPYTCWLARNRRRLSSRRVGIRMPKSGKKSSGNAEDGAWDSGKRS
jgi:hypothetical protein